MQECRICCVTQVAKVRVNTSKLMRQKTDSQGLVWAPIYTSNCVLMFEGLRIHSLLKLPQEA